MKKRKLALIAALAVLTASIASARPLPGWVKYYFDAQGSIVGAFGWDCDLNPINWGARTDRSYTTNICLE